MKKVIFATGNQGKMKEIREILGDLDIELLSLKDAGIDADIVEDGKTFEENAQIKAKTICDLTGEIVLADDSGLEIDYLNKEISRAAAKMMAHETNVKASKNIGSYLDMTSNIERIGDHAVNICDYTKLIEEKHIVFSDDAKQQMEEMKMICEKMFHNISKVPEDTQEWLQKVHDSENFIDQKTEEFYESHLERINRGECNDEACIIFSEMLTDFERIGDHTWNVAKQMAKIIERG